MRTILLILVSVVGGVATDRLRGEQDLPVVITLFVGEEGKSEMSLERPVAGQPGVTRAVRGQVQSIDEAYIAWLGSEEHLKSLEIADVKTVRLFMDAASAEMTGERWLSRLREIASFAVKAGFEPVSVNGANGTSIAFEPLSQELKSAAPWLLIRDEGSARVSAEIAAKSDGTAVFGGGSATITVPARLVRVSAAEGATAGAVQRWIARLVEGGVTTITVAGPDR